MSQPTQSSTLTNGQTTNPPTTSSPLSASTQSAETAESPEFYSISPEIYALASVAAIVSGVSIFLAWQWRRKKRVEKKLATRHHSKVWMFFMENHGFFKDVLQGVL